MFNSHHFCLDPWKSIEQLMDKTKRNSQRIINATKQNTAITVFALEQISHMRQAMERDIQNYKTEVAKQNLNPIRTPTKK